MAYINNEKYISHQPVPLPFMQNTVACELQAVTQSFNANVYGSIRLSLSGTSLESIYWRRQTMLLKYSRSD